MLSGSGLPGAREDEFTAIPWRGKALTAPENKAEVRDAICRRYGSMSTPDFSFLSDGEVGRRAIAFREALCENFSTIDVTNLNDDVSARQAVTKRRAQLGMRTFIGRSIRHAASNR